MITFCSFSHMKIFLVLLTKMIAINVIPITVEIGNSVFIRYFYKTLKTRAKTWTKARVGIGSLLSRYKLRIY